MLRLRRLLTLIIAGSLTLPLHAATITVADAGADYTSIQAAIDAANNSDEIIVSPGTYLENISFNGKAVTVRSASGDPADTIIDGGGNGSVVTCDSGETLMTVLDGFTITNGSADYGGGMFNNNSSPTVTNCTFSGNTADVFGGGMVNYDNSSPTVTNCTFSGNTADVFGGGGMVNYDNSSPTATNCTFSGNTANDYGGGGMINYNSSPTVTNCTFSGNTANDYCSGNTAGIGGGGMFNNNSSPTVTNCTFRGNEATYGGGGMRNYDNSNPTVTNCIFSGNTAKYGGGMHNEDSRPTVTNCTFSGNEAEYGGGMYNDDNGRPTVTNCILWGDSPNEIYNSSSSTLTVSFSDVQGGLSSNTVDGGGNIAVDPLFVDANGPDNIVGTDDDNLHFLDSSPCIDAGANAAVPAGISFDLDGNSRFKDSPDSPDTGYGTAPLVDMGPYENMDLCLGDDTSGDSDGDGFCDNIDACPGFDDNIDTDTDGVPDGCDLCPGFDDNGLDSDSDGVPDACDICEGFDDSSTDTDDDGVPDQCDVCDGFDDTFDDDGDGVPDDCDLCPGFDDVIDYDSDGVPYGCDRCGDADDNGPDSDNDGTPDACDDCILPGDHNCDGIVNLIDQALVALHWMETI